AAVLPEEGLQGRLAFAGPEQPLARLLQGVQDRILALALVFLLHRFALARGVVSGEITAPPSWGAWGSRRGSLRCRGGRAGPRPRPRGRYGRSGSRSASRPLGRSSGTSSSRSRLTGCSAG